MRKPITTFFTTLALVSLAACTGDVHEAPQSESIADGFTLMTATESGVEATWSEGNAALRFASFIDEDGMVVGEVHTHGGALVSRIVVPLASDTDMADSLGRIARSHAETLVNEVDVDVTEMLVHYRKTLKELYDSTAHLGNSTIRFALLWQEEVLIRMFPENLDIETSSRDIVWDDTAYSPDGQSVELVHTNLIFSDHLAVYQGTPEVIYGCNLNCSWYNLCCKHDQACVNCNKWYCGPTCKPGCFGGKCGGGR